MKNKRYLGGFINSDRPLALSSGIGMRAVPALANVSCLRKALSGGGGGGGGVHLVLGLLQGSTEEHIKMTADHLKLMK